MVPPNLVAPNPAENASLEKANTWVKVLAPVMPNMEIYAIQTQSGPETAQYVAAVPYPGSDEPFVSSTETLQSLGVGAADLCYIHVRAQGSPDLHNVAGLDKMYKSFSDARSGIGAVLSDFGLSQDQADAVLAGLPGYTQFVDGVLGVTR